MPPLILAIIASAGLGAVIGLIRQWSEQAQNKFEGGFSGVRTFTLWSLLGCIAAFASQEFSPAVLPVVLGAVAVHFSLFALGNDNDGPGSTTFAATMLTVMIGALVLWEEGEAAVLLSALTMVLLGNKRPVHAWTNAFNHTDIRATLQFIAITGVILPLVPDRDFGPFDGFNPHSTWMMVVLISGVGFSGYVLMRLFDTRAGIAITSLFGGIASSTATTLAFSRRSREDAKHPRDYVMAIAIASTVMLPRVLVILAFVNRELTRLLIWPFALMAVPGIVYAALMWWQERGKRRKSELPSVGNPLNLSAALQFAALFAVISFIVKAAQQTGHLQSSLLPLSFVSGLTNMEAISLSLGQNFHGDDLRLAAKGVILAAVANSIIKGVLAAVIGSKSLRWPIAIMMGTTSVCGVAGMFLVGDSGGDTQPPPTAD